MEKISEDLISKIQKIINFKESSEAIGNKEQTEVAAIKLQELLLKHNLSLDEVTAANVSNRIKVVAIEEIYVDTEEFTKPHESFWVPRLYVGVARNNMCRVWWGGPPKFVVNIVGHSHNLALVSYICEQLLAKIRITEIMAWKEYETNNPYGEKRGTFRRGFLEGASVGITQRLDDEYYRMQQENHNPLGVMVISKKAEVTEWLYNKYPSMRPGYRDPNPTIEIPVKRSKKIKLPKGPRKNSSTDGWQMGHEAGKSMSINKGVDGNTNKGRIE